MGGEGLPAPDPGGGGGGSGEDVPVLDVRTGGAVALDAMGPVVGTSAEQRPSFKSAFNLTTDQA